MQSEHQPRVVLEVCVTGRRKFYHQELEHRTRSVINQYQLKQTNEKTMSEYPLKFNLKLYCPECSKCEVDS